MQNRYGYFQRVNGVYYALDLQTQRQCPCQSHCLQGILEVWKRSRSGSSTSTRFRCHEVMDLAAVLLSVPGGALTDFRSAQLRGMSRIGALDTA